MSPICGVYGSLGDKWRCYKDAGHEPPHSYENRVGPNLPISDPVNHPEHYLSHPSGVECIQIAEHFDFCLGNAIKYLWRADQKNGVEDLKKAIWYIQREIELRGRSS